MVRSILAIVFIFSLKAEAKLFNPQAWAPLTVLTATSATKTPTASNNYNAMTSSSITITPGTWELMCGLQNADSGGSSGMSFVLLSIFGANGADSSSTPTLLSATSNLTVNSAMHSDGILYSAGTSTSSVRLGSVCHAIVTVTASVTVYPVPLVTVTTPANARLTTVITGRRLY